MLSLFLSILPFSLSPSLSHTMALFLAFIRISNAIVSSMDFLARIIWFVME